MSRTHLKPFTPWIETLILGYSSRDGGDGGCCSGGGGGGGGGGDDDDDDDDDSRMMAYVVAADQITSSQALTFEGLTGLLFLSDGALQLPAVLTASAWRQLQEQDDRDSVTGLVHNTVCIRDYRLHFYVAPQLANSRFYLSVGGLVVASSTARPVKHNTPLCTSLDAIRQKVSQTWTEMMAAKLPDTQMSAEAWFDLSQVVDLWQNDSGLAVLDEVLEVLLEASDPQPSTSTHTPLATRPGTATGWDVDRVKYERATRFVVPVKYLLLLPEEGAPQPDVGCRAADVKTDAVLETNTREDPPLPLDEDDLAAHLMNSHITVLSNPWDIFPPPCISSHSSPEEEPTHTSTQLPAVGQETPQHSCFPPYQQPACSTSLPESARAPSPRSPDKRVAQQNAPAEDGEGGIGAKDRDEAGDRKYGKRPRYEEEDQREESRVSGGNPPSWLFDTQAEEGRGHTSAQSAGATWRKTPMVHSCGRLFSYSYRVSGQNLQDAGGLAVSESLLSWTVKYLLPQPRECAPGVRDL